MLDIKPTETSILHVNNNSFTGPLFTGAFEERALGLKTGVCLNVAGRDLAGRGRGCGCGLGLGLT